MRLAYRKANALLNQHISNISDGQTSFHIHYWGFMPNHYNNSLHRHSFFEVCYVQQGTGSYQDDDALFPLEPGTLFCSRPGIWHQIRSEQGLVLFFIAFEIDEALSSADGRKPFQELAAGGQAIAPHEAAALSARIWRTLFSLAESEAGVSRLPMNHLALALLHSFPQAFSPEPHLQAGAMKEDSGEHRHLERAKRYIRDNLSSPLHMAQVALELDISPRHLSRIFQACLGQTFVHYIQERRIQQAKDLLLHTDYPIKDIAERCGFESVHYFTRVFTKQLGVSPARFRRAQFADGRQNLS
ncbi:AraC family transcriptional regulator [Paenibacillus sp. FSL M7-0896]|uniref:AraC family transcriptional regulator n=1 Tax=unclassified Paenibacillus TaxID=185978 RepID=UPI0030D6E54A